MGLPHHQNMGRERADHHWGISMTLDHFMQYQTESVKRASMQPVAKHNLNQTKTKQPKRAAA
ncbi:hypothetical protein NUBL21979_45580 [Klebsiella pneumoniae]|nr:hypothetical protein NUBL21979_45580 [Klebsiella pneumoniae]